MYSNCFTTIFFPFSIISLSMYLPPGSIQVITADNIIIKNTAYRVAVKENPIFTMDDFIQEIQKEREASFESEKQMGFLNK